MRIISSQSFFLYAARPTVISTIDSGAEKSPVSMAPVPPPSHCHFDRNGAKRSGVEWSGEISGPNGTSPIAVGDLGAQSNNRFQTPLSPYRHAAPLEMTCRRPALQSWGKETNNIDTIRPTVISTKALQSGELSGLNGTSASPAPLSFRPKRSKAEWSGEISAPMVLVPLPPTVISTETEQSGAEWRNLRPQWHSPITVGDLSTQSINGVQMPLSSYRHAAPLEMTCWRAANHRFGNFKA